MTGAPVVKTVVTALSSDRTMSLTSPNGSSSIAMREVPLGAPPLLMLALRMMFGLTPSLLLGFTQAEKVTADAPSTNERSSPRLM